MSDTDQVEEPTLDDFLTAGELQQEAETEEPVESKEETESEEAAEAETESTPDSESEETHVPLTGLLDERGKRQAAEDKVKALEKQVADLTKEPDQKRPDIFEDQEGAFEHLEKSFENKRLKDRFDMSRMLMSEIKDDFAEREQQFMKLAEADPTLGKRLLEHDNPAKFAYDTAVKHEQLEKMENLDEWREQERAKLREEIKAELETEAKEGAEKEAEKRDSVTPSLAKSRSDGGTDDVEEDDLGSVLTGIG